MSKTHEYEVNLHWNEGRKGILSSPVLDETIHCATPPEFAKGVPGIWSPEHLYAASINSCYMATFLAIAENFRLSFKDFRCTTVCQLELTDGKYFISRASIKPTLVLGNPEDRTKATRVLEKSKAACLVTNSIKTEIDLDIILV